MSKTEFTQLMKSQYGIWHKTPNSRMILDDICHCVANLLNLKLGSVERDRFFNECGSRFYDR